MKKTVIVIATILYCHFPFTLHASETLKIVAVYTQSVTTVKRYVAAEDLRGVIIAIDKINASGGLLGKQVDIVEVLSNSAIEARVNAKQYAELDGLIGVIGANISNITLNIAPILQEKKIPVISPISTNPKVTLVGNYIFRACFTDPFQGKVMARYALDHHNAKTSVLLKKASSTYSLSLAKHFQDEFEKSGKILWQESYLQEDIDFTTILKKIRSTKPDVIFLPGHGRDVGMILKQAHAMGIQSTFLGGDGWGKGALGIAGSEAAEGHSFSNHWHMNNKLAASQTFVNKYHERFGKGLIAASAPLAYDATMILADAVRRAGSTDRAKIRSALAETKNFNGITGMITFDENGDPINKAAAILKYQDNKIAFVKNIKP